MAPRINACGRMGHAEKALKLFLSKDINEVNELTKELNEYNRIRQETEKNIYQEALELIEKEHLDKKDTIVVCRRRMASWCDRNSSFKNNRIIF